MTGISSKDSTADEQLCDTEPIKSCHDSTVTTHRTASHHHISSSHSALAIYLHLWDGDTTFD